MSIDIEDFMNTKVTFPNMEQKYPKTTVDKMDNVIISYQKNLTKKLSTLMKKNKLNIKEIELLHRYHQLITKGVIQPDSELEFSLTSKKGRGQSGVEVIAVSTYPMGKYVGCPANCHFCPKEPEMNFPVIVNKKIGEDDTFILFEFVPSDEQYYHFTKVISSITINSKVIPVKKIVSYGKTPIISFLKEDFESEIILPMEVMAHKTAQPRSYLSSEPAVSRANQNQWDCIKQFRDIAIKRIHCGHSVTKVEGIVIGGTWSYYPKDYQKAFIRDFYYAANNLYNDSEPVKLTLEEEIKLNRTSKCRVIGLTLETRPDFIHPAEIKLLRSYGCTRVQLGIQHTDNHILKKINRGCTHEKNVIGIKLLKDAGFKVDIHLMPDLPDSSPEKDLRMFEQVLNSPELQADQWKIYPCQTLEYTKIKEWYEAGEYKPYYEQKKVVNFDNIYLDNYYNSFKKNLFLVYMLSVYIVSSNYMIFIIPFILFHIYLEFMKQNRETNPLHQLLIHIVPRVHPWIRLNRIVRDNPKHMIVGGLNISHYRNEIEKYLDETNNHSQDIRYREIKGREYDPDHTRLIVRKYQASEGLEYFLSFEDTKNDYLLGFLRLRIPAKQKHFMSELSYSALVRELHVYGWMVPQGTTGKIVQHQGFGKKLLKKAEEIAKSHSFDKIAVISGEGVREYYQKKNGYHTEGTYEVKLI